MTENVLRKVQALLERAEHTGTNDAERAACFAKADELMVKYAIDQALLDQGRTAAQRSEPVVANIHVVPENVARTIWTGHQWGMLRALAPLARCRIVELDRSEARVVGYRSDVEYLQMMFVGAQMTFVQKLLPAWDPQRTEDENVKILKEAGWKWERIARAGGFDWPDGGALIRAYRRQCRREGVEPTPHTQRHDAYRRSFADGFLVRLSERVDALTREHANIHHDSGVSTALVLADRSTAVERKLYDLHPELRPLTNEELAAHCEKARQEVAEAIRHEHEQRQAMLAAMTDKERERFLRKEREDRDKEQRRQEREYRRWERYEAEEERRNFDSSGVRAGKSAADAVHLGPAQGTVGAARRSELG